MRRMSYLWSVGSPMTSQFKKVIINSTITGISPRNEHLTVTRALVAEGMKPGLVFAAAFGEHQPVVANLDEETRSQNRRVEIAPVPRGTGDGSEDK